jgi:hypothetical protein
MAGNPSTTDEGSRENSDEETLDNDNAESDVTTSEEAVEVNSESEHEFVSKPFK